MNSQVSQTAVKWVFKTGNLTGLSVCFDSDISHLTTDLTEAVKDLEIHETHQ